MNILNNKGSFVTRIAGVLLTGVVILSSCTKDDNTPTVLPAGLAISHVSPGSPEYSFKLNGTKVNIKALTYNTFNTYGALQPGSYEFSITKKDSARVVTKSTVTLKTDQAYSVYIADVPSKATLIVTEDDLSAPATDKAKLRFVNLSPDAGSLDLGITGKAVVFSKTDFKASTAYTSVDPGAEVGFEIKENAGTTILATLPKVKVEKGKIYTILAKGLKAATDSTKLALGVITNK
ncbi:DUF4397 domain-containing protein [Mucilaginibacter sp. ZT4R22]|uniref:DUF4397 domain-containing protein n=1 Tax=Mucilaginibacter pankratovii TaxID=2772110 RepID=A0ABR7WJU5_9SPHI|nr:DUF4397 domain-containing protein [Mucilaginibacter pankratovii]MBD1362436.1 DUF4397 domain-containing protein [Mucilaginibacter pankratovii]